MGEREHTGGTVSWPSNGTNSVTADSRGLSGSTETGGERPTVDDRVEQFREEYPELADKRLSMTDGQKLRRDVTEPIRAPFEREVMEYGEVKSQPGTKTVERWAATWSDALTLFLEQHVEYEGARLRIGRGREGDPDRETFEVPLSDAWGPEYADREYARAKALERSIDREWGSYSTVMLTFTASATPDGSDHTRPVEHLRSLTDTWREYTYNTLRNTMRALGFDRNEWCYWSQGEPHTGDGSNACFGHIHVAVYVNGEVTESDFHRVIDSHVEHCEAAKVAAHDYSADDPDERPISVNGDVQNLGSYMAEYAGTYGGALLDRPVEYLAWGALHWATNTQRARRCMTANDAIAADRCRQRAASPESDQDQDHGERLRDNDGNGADLVCAECGSGWGIPQGKTIVEARSETPTHDGGDELQSRTEEIQGRWPDANAAATVGEGPSTREVRKAVEQHLRDNPGAAIPEIAGSTGLPPPKVREVVRVDDPTVAAGFESPVSWAPEAVVRGSGSEREEHRVSGDGGVDMVALDVPTVGGQPIWDRPEGTIFRCDECNFGTYEPETMRDHTLTHYPAEPEAIVRHEQSSRESGSQTESPTKSGGETSHEGQRSLTQNERVRSVITRLQESDVADLGEIVCEVDAPEPDVRATVRRLKRKGKVMIGPNGMFLTV